MSTRRRARPASTRIAIINHKGGVGKTTLTFHLACILAEWGNRVLCVDADPQCNLTVQMLGEKKLDRLLDRSDRTGGTLWSLLWNRNTRDLPIDVDVGKQGLELGLIPGDVRIFQYEEQLFSAWSHFRERPTESLELLTRLGRGIDSVGAASDFDVVLFDTAPSLGPLNRNVVLESDFVLVPVGLDLFSARGLKTLGRAFVGWLEQWAVLTRFAPADLLSRPGSPVLAGYVVQRAPARPTRGARSAAARLQNSVRTDLKAAIAKHDRRLARGTENDMRIGVIPEISQMHETQPQLAPIWDTYPKTKEPFEELAKRLIARMHKMR